MNRYINNLRYYSSERREPELREEDVHKPSLFPSDKVQITLLGSILETYIDDDNKIKEFRDTIQSNFESFMFKLGQDQPVRYWFTVHSSEGIKALGKASILYPLTLSPLTMANHIITEFMRVHDQYGGHDQTSSRSEFDMIVVNINWKQYVDEGQLAKIKDEGLLYQFRKAIVLETNSKLQKIAGTGRHYLNPNGIRSGPPGLFELARLKNTVIKVEKRSISTRPQWEIMTLYDVKDVEQKSPIKKWMEIRNKKEIKK